MSYWALTVITNLLTVLPNGDEIARIVWGAYSVDEPTLRRFFAIHYLLPFIILALVVVHVTQLHTFGSNNPLCVSSKVDSVPFMPYFHVKDLLGILLMLGAIALFISIAPNSLNHPDCFVKANPLVTPESIVPEWYLLPFYAILRSISFQNWWYFSYGWCLCIFGFAALVVFRAFTKIRATFPLPSLDFWIDLFCFGYCWSRTS